MKLFKSILLIFVLFIVGFSSIVFWFAGWSAPNDKLYTNKEGNVIKEIDNSLQEWANQSSWWLDGISRDLSSDHAESTIDYISRWINYFLTILGIIILLLLIYNWIVMITAAWDEEKYSNWLKNMKNYAIWLIFIWLAWLFIMLIFYVIWNKLDV